jgi:proteic killer suppression protein
VTRTRNTRRGPFHRAGNQLKALKRDRPGQDSIRINDQFRIRFLWKDGDAYAVEITDYH